MKPWLVTFATFNSRFSERLVNYSSSIKNRKFSEVILSEEERETIRLMIDDIQREYSIPILKITIQPDHVHMLILANNKDELASKVKKIKGISSRRFHKLKNIPEGSNLWARRYHCRLITTDEGFISACKYIDQNDAKHLERWS